MNLNPEIMVSLCYGCGNPIGPIRLPASIHQRIVDTPEGSPLVGFELTVGCPECKRVSVYTPGSFQFHLFGTPDLRIGHGGRFAVQISRLCGEENCEALITIHTAAAFGSKPSEFRRVAWNFGLEVRCSHGHYLKRCPAAEYSIDLFGESEAHLQ
jgi:hypothetical protein